MVMGIYDHKRTGFIGVPAAMSGIDTELPGEVGLPLEAMQRAGVLISESAGFQVSQRIISSQT
jgi:hypothetical protein